MIIKDRYKRQSSDKVFFLRYMIQDFAKPIRGTQNARGDHPHSIWKYLVIIVSLSMISAASYYAFSFWTL